MSPDLDPTTPATHSFALGGTSMEKSRTVDTYGRIYTTADYKILSAEPFVDRIGPANMTVGESIYWWDFSSRYGNPPVLDDTPYKTVGELETELGKHVAAVGDTKTGDLVYPLLGFFQDDTVWAPYARMHFDFFDSQHTGDESTDGLMRNDNQWWRLLDDWSGVLMLEEFGGEYVCPWFTFELPPVDMSGRSFRDTFNQLGNFVEDADPASNYIGAALHDGVPYIAIKGYADRKKTRAPDGHHRMYAAVILQFIANMTEAYIGDDTGATLDQYSATP